MLEHVSSFWEFISGEYREISFSKCIKNATNSTKCNLSKSFVRFSRPSFQLAGKFSLGWEKGWIIWRSRNFPNEHFVKSNRLAFFYFDENRFFIVIYIHLRFNTLTFHISNSVCMTRQWMDSCFCSNVPYLVEEYTIRNDWHSKYSAGLVSYKCTKTKKWLG